MAHLNSAGQSRSAWTEQEDDLLRAAVKKYGDRAWATVASEVPGRSSKSCSDRWRNFLSPDIEHPRKSPFSEWEVAVVVQAQHRYGNNWKAISMLLPGRTNRAVKNLFVGNLKWGARLPEIQNRYLENKTPLEDLLEVTPDYPGGPPKERPGILAFGGPQRHLHMGGTASPSSLVAASTSSAGSAWASDMTMAEAAMMGHGPMGGLGARRPRDGEGGSPTAGMISPRDAKRHRLVGSPGQVPRTSETGGSPPARLLGLEPIPMGPPMGLDMGTAMPMGLHVGTGMPQLGFAGPGLPLPRLAMPGDLAPLPLPALAGTQQHLALHLPPPPQTPQPVLGAVPLPSPQGVLAPSPQPLAAPLSAGSDPSHNCSAASGDALPHPHPAPNVDAGAGGIGDDALLLQGHASNDSIALAALMDTILEDDELLSDPAMGQHLLASPTSSPLHHGSAAAIGAPTLGGDTVPDAGVGMGCTSAWPAAWAGPRAGGDGGSPAVVAAPGGNGVAPFATGRAMSCGTPALPPRSPGAPAWFPQATGLPVGASSPCQLPGGIDPAAFSHPSRRVSTGDFGAAAAAAPSSPSDGQGSAGHHQVLPQQQQQQHAAHAHPPAMMRALCAQLQAENMMLMHRVHSLQERLVAPTPAGLAPLSSGAAPAASLSR